MAVAVAERITPVEAAHKMGYQAALAAVAVGGVVEQHPLVLVLLVKVLRVVQMLFQLQTHIHQVVAAALAVSVIILLPLMFLVLVALD